MLLLLVQLLPSLLSNALVFPGLLLGGAGLEMVVDAGVDAG
jgi:hypothetical protein